MVQQLSTNTFTTAKWIVSPTASNGTHTTIASALTSASSGDTIFIRNGTYTENLTLKAGVNLSAYSANGITETVIISGKCSFSATGSVGLNGLSFQTNSDYAIEVTGNNNSDLFLINCRIDATNNTAINMASSGGASSLFFESSYLNITTTGIAYFTMTAGNNMIFNACFLNNSGASTTASNNAAGTVVYQGCTIFAPISSSGTGGFGTYGCNIDTSAVNAVVAAVNGSGSTVLTASYLASGTATCLTVGTGAVLGVYNCCINTSNAAAVSGLGTYTHSNNSYPGTAAITATAQTGGTSRGLISSIAPSAGYVGEHIRSATNSSVSNSTNTNLTSISLTAGVWDISALGNAVWTGNSTVFTVGISTTSATFGTQGDDYSNWVNTGVVAQQSIAIPSWRLLLTSTTTVYLVVATTFSTGACTVFGRISATRVG